MAQSLSVHGYVESMDMDSADLVILNTCSIRAKAEQKVMSLLGYLRKTKQAKPSLRICVAGCVAQQEGQRIIERMGHVDLVVGTQNIYNIASLLENSQTGGSRVVTELSADYNIPVLLPSVNMKAETESRKQSVDAPFFSRFVTIMQGCNNYCTYCVVPYTRGREISRINSDIIDEVKLLVSTGVKEITLLGQNVNSYGKTNEVCKGGGAYCFSDLLKDVARIEGLQRLRFTTSNPKDLTDDLMRSFRDIDILCPQFHLPVQAGSNEVLRRMNRKYTIEQYLELVDKLRSYRSDIALTTDIIVGFPGESDSDFEGTMKVLEKVRYHGSFSFKYSDRPGTRASDFDDKVPENVKSERLSRFQERQDQISLERNREYIGQQKQLLVELVEDKKIKGRSSTNHIVHLVNETERAISPGDIIVARITGAGQHSLRADLE